jgi:hypothetical protein
MGTRSRNLFLGTRAWLVRTADNLTAICELIVYTMWILNISQPYRPPQPVTRITLLLLLFFLLLFYFYQLSWGGGYNIYVKHIFYFQSDDTNPWISQYCQDFKHLYKCSMLKRTSVLTAWASCYIHEAGAICLLWSTRFSVFKNISGSNIYILG